MKHKNNHIFTTRELIEIQSTAYYYQHPDLGFATIANSYPEYAQAIGNIFARMWKKLCQFKNERKTSKMILVELGPGTGIFAEKIVDVLMNQDISFSYHLVDVNERISEVAERIDATFHHETFERFARKWKKKIDFLVANQALDMWPGKNFILGKNSTKKVGWKLLQPETMNFITKDDLMDAHLSWKKNSRSLFWIKHLQVGKKKWKKISPKKKDSFLEEHVKLPMMLTKLLREIRLGGIIQDYWTFGEPNPLAAGLTKVDCRLIQETFASDPWTPLYRYYETILEHNEKNRNKRLYTKKQAIKDDLPSITWFPAPIIPFGSVDVTHAPNMEELIDKLSKLHFNHSILTVDELINNELQSAISTSPTDWKSERFIVFFEKEWLTALSFQ